LVFGTITTIDASPVNPQVLYAGTDDANVWRTLDGGTNWTSISAGLPQRWCTRVTAHPDSENVVYVAFSGYKYLDYMPHLFRSSDYGTTWSDIGAGLPEGPINDVRVDPDHPAILYVGTDFGVYYSLNDGGTWAALGTGLPTSSIADLQITTGTPRYLVAGTHGRSMWKYSLANVALQDPIELTLVPGSAQLRWRSAEGAASYNVYGVADLGGPETLLAAAVTDTSWVDANFASRPARFMYWVRAVQ
jgi:hypothetical protein